MTTKEMKKESAAEEECDLHTIIEAIRGLMESVGDIRNGQNRLLRDMETIQASLESISSANAVAASFSTTVQREAASSSKVSAPSSPETIPITERPWKKSANGVSLNTTSIYNVFKVIGELEENYPGSIRALAETILACKMGFSEGVKVIDWTTATEEQKRLKDFITTPLSSLETAIEALTKSDTKTSNGKKVNASAKTLIANVLVTSVGMFKFTPQNLASLFQRTGSGASRTPYDLDAKASSKKMTLFDSYFGWAWYLRLPPETKGKISPSVIINEKEPVPLHAIKKVGTPVTTKNEDVDPDAELELP
jgi:hypothetical protein